MTPSEVPHDCPLGQSYRVAQLLAVAATSPPHAVLAHVQMRRMPARPDMSIDSTRADVASRARQPDILQAELGYTKELLGTS